MKVLQASSTEWGETTIVAVDDLYPYVNIDYYINELPTKKEFYTAYSVVRDSVEANGLKNPLVVAIVTKEEWETMGHSQLDIFPYPDVISTTVLQVRCGCQRLHMAKDLGFSHIECIVLDKWQDSTKLCEKMRGEWKKNKDNFRS
jgi:hypothetical protein